MSSVASDRQLVEEFIIPKERGRAFPVRAGQVLRVIEIEGGQTVDFNAFVSPDYCERFSAAELDFSLASIRAKAIHSGQTPRTSDPCSPSSRTRSERTTSCSRGAAE